jgi:hypothetical protein
MAQALTAMAHSLQSGAMTIGFMLLIVQGILFFLNGE